MMLAGRAVATHIAAIEKELRVSTLLVFRYLVVSHMYHPLGYRSTRWQQESYRARQAHSLLTGLAQLLDSIEDSHIRQGCVHRGNYREALSFELLLIIICSKLLTPMSP